MRLSLKRQLKFFSGISHFTIRAAKRRFDSLAEMLLPRIKKFYKNPKSIERFEEWKKSRINNRSVGGSKIPPLRYNDIAKEDF